jgi:hypothetical protein
MMIHLEIQEGKKPMKKKPLVGTSDLGSNAACAMRIAMAVCPPQDQRQLA